MDVFTHALIPYLLGRSLGLRQESIKALVLGGIAPDLDILILWIDFLCPSTLLITHRGITHSLVFGFFTAQAALLLAAWIGQRRSLSRRRKTGPYPAHSLAFPGLVVYAYCGVLIHIFMDYWTTRGVPLLYPLDAARWSAELFFYTETPLIAASLLIVVVLFRRRGMDRGRGEDDVNDGVYDGGSGVKDGGVSAGKRFYFTGNGVTGNGVTGNGVTGKGVTRDWHGGRADARSSDASSERGAGRERGAEREILVLLVVLFLVVAGIRVEGKGNAKSGFSGVEIEAYPDPGLFDWVVLAKGADKFEVYSYSLGGSTEPLEAFKRLEVRYFGPSKGDGLMEALRAADELPQVKTFKWRAYAVATNASLLGDAWYIEHYDPVVRARLRDASPAIRRAAKRYDSIELRVPGQGATIV